jgi:hypothetical protein
MARPVRDGILLNGMKDIFFIKGDVKFIKELPILIQKCSFLVVFFLIHYVVVHLIHLALAIRKCTITLLPLKLPFNKTFLIYPL